MRMLLFFLLSAIPAFAQSPITILERRELPIERSAASTHSLELTLAYQQGGGWAAEAIHAAVRQSAQILAQCRVALSKVELVKIDAPPRFRDYYTPISRELARAVPLARPAVYFVSGTRQNPAFDAEAIGRGNSDPRPELRDTIWITRGTQDLGIVLAHELAHVLMDSGEHSAEPDNLMREDTAPGNAQLAELQCARLRDVGTANDLLRPR